MAVARSLLIDVFEDGLTISFSKKHRGVFIYFNITVDGKSIVIPSATHRREAGSIPNCKLCLSKDFPENKTPHLSTSLPGLIGYLSVNEGYLLFISKYSTVVDLPNCSVNKIEDTLLVPLNYKEAIKVLTKYDYNLSKEGKETEVGQEDEIDHDNFEEEQDDDEVDGDEEGIDEQEGINDLYDLESVLTQDALKSITNTSSTDMFFTKSGILTDSFKSNPFVSINSENINRQSMNSPQSSHLSKSSSLASSDTNQQLRRAVSVVSLNPAASNIKGESYLSAPKSSQLSRSFRNKLRRNIRSLFKYGGFYFSWETNLFEKLDFTSRNCKDQTYKSLLGNNSSFFWNHHLLSPILSYLKEDYSSNLIITPIVEGFIDKINLELTSEAVLTTANLLLVSLRSTKRCGLRYMRRGIDYDGNVANFVSTTQYLLFDKVCSSYETIRGSIPVFFTQDPSKLKPRPTLLKSEEETRDKFDAHYDKLKQKYQDITSISLVEKSEKENSVGALFQELANQKGLNFIWFDFHETCSKMRYDNVKLLLDETIENNKEDVVVKDQLKKYSYTSIENSTTKQTQKGIMRINCIDCLDRTNIVSKYLSEIILRVQFQDYGFTVKNEKVFSFNYSNLWANNGDAISTQYASTNALKGDFTRTQKRRYSGVVNDGLLTLSRYYYGYFVDFFKQVLIDFLLGNSNQDSFEQFESSLGNLDPSIIEEKNITDQWILNNIVNVVLETHNEFTNSEKLIDSFWVLSTFKPDEVKGSDLKDTMFIVTNRTVYFARLTENKNKSELEVYSIKVENVSTLNYGYYFSEAFTKATKNSFRNIGLRFYFKRSAHKIININTQESISNNDCVSLQSFDRQLVGSNDPHGEQELSTDVEKFLSFKFPHNLSYSRVKETIRLISKICYCSQLERKDIVSLSEAKKEVSIWKVLEYEFKRYIWA